MSARLSWVLPEILRLQHLNKREANENVTSLPVLEFFRSLGWRRDEIIPQKAAGHGFVDYALKSKAIKEVAFYVEVKAFHLELEDSALASVKKYLHNRQDPYWRIGVLTNFRHWRILLTFPGISQYKLPGNVIELAPPEGSRMTKNGDWKSDGILIKKAGDINAIANLLRRRITGFSQIRRQSASDPYLIDKLYLHLGGNVQKQIRAILEKQLRGSVPQYDMLRHLIDEYLDNEPISHPEVNKKHLRHAMRHPKTLRVMESEIEGILEVSRIRKYFRKGLRTLLSRQWRDQV